MVSPASKTQNEPERCAGDVPKWHIWDVPIIAAIVYHFWYKMGKLWENAGNILNVPGFPVSLMFPYNVPKVSLIYTESGTL